MWAGSGEGVNRRLGPREGVVDGHVVMLMPRRRCCDEDARYATAAVAVSRWLKMKRSTGDHCDENVAIVSSRRPWRGDKAALGVRAEWGLTRDQTGCPEIDDAPTIFGIEVVPFAGVDVTEGVLAGCNARCMARFVAACFVAARFVEAGFVAAGFVAAGFVSFGPDGRDDDRSRLPWIRRRRRRPEWTSEVPSTGKWNGAKISVEIIFLKI